MISVKNNLIERKLELNKMFIIVEELDGETGKIKEACVLKSLIFMMIYNSVESTISSCLNVVHDIIENIEYKNLNKEIQKLWSEYYFCGANGDNVSRQLTAFSDGMQKFPKADLLLQKLKLYSGNIDVRKSRTVLKKYGMLNFHINETDSSNILKVKRKRNELAHGEYSFSEASNQTTTQEIKAISTSCFVFLEKVIQLFESYIENEKYLNS
ncbi:MAE_28990/MAE_18760 family HEPN-like nuclease [Komagataeibacter swingsii]|uniref:MAE-28990/MAE-18760-like HEPN domain-containing protein n=1 Tax=Komagataeibacter swingsii TaxID=215220 RepID=A0A850P3U6_9PROT|nr:MAE_28990/MAE_18760 family HEPN-like nuclease [Komagataeibacter swingsii]NVN38628.1 hypothetical protein [Komagataeibacter swingsii]